MKIYVLGSTTFMKEMVDAKNRLCNLGFDGWIHAYYEKLVSGDEIFVKRLQTNEMTEIKRELNTFNEHYAHILKSDAILIVNCEKNGIKNYIGGNVLIEMGQAYVNKKKIFFLHGMPSGLSYMDEINAMDPICLNGDLSQIA